MVMFNDTCADFNFNKPPVMLPVKLTHFELV